MKTEPSYIFQHQTNNNFVNCLLHESFLIISKNKSKKTENINHLLGTRGKATSHA